MKIKGLGGRLVCALLAIVAAGGILAAMPPASIAASDETELAAIINGFDPGNGGPAAGQLLAIADTASHTVTVACGATGVSRSLELDIAAGVTVIWKAEYYGWASGEGLMNQYGEGTLEITDGGAVVNYGSGPAVASHGAHSMVKVSGGVVSAADGYAITAYDGGSVAVSGGLVFASGMSGAILLSSGAPAISGSGIVCAWNNSVWPAEYAEGSADSLVAMPANSVRWGINGDQSGILYMNGTTVGFLPLSGVAVHPLSAADTVPAAMEPEFVPYVVRVTSSRLNIRKGHSKDTPIVGVITDRGLYTIVEEADGSGAMKWGKLKSGAGWISLEFTRKQPAAQSGGSSGATPKPAVTPKSAATPSTGGTTSSPTGSAAVTPPPPTNTPRLNFADIAQPLVQNPGIGSFVTASPTQKPTAEKTYQTRP